MAAGEGVGGGGEDWCFATTLEGNAGSPLFVPSDSC